jgi:Secretion system C-terminal sorting domain
MKWNFTKPFFRLIFISLIVTKFSVAQNSVLVNFGTNSCSGSAAPYFSMIKNPLSGLPEVMAGCDFSQQVPDIFSVFIAYNPKNNKVYIADVRSGTDTKIWLLDVGLPLNINCPVTIPVTPTYSYNYIANNFEFDNNGDLWAFSSYNSITGQCNLDKFDVNNGTVISSKVLQFPQGNFPTSINSGDLTILPNGRLFATLGSGVCQLYEITNYNTPSGDAIATYLQTLPKDCYGIAFLNGNLELTGYDFNNGCYYYDYDISTNVIGPEKTFQNGELPIDNTSFTPSVGSTKRLISATKINSNTADLVYEVYAENMGNVIINNISLSDDLAAAFGAANVSDVSASFVTGYNAAGLTINPAYNGTTVTVLLNSGKNLPNKILSATDYFFKVQVKCRVTNLIPSTTYYNSAIVGGNIGGGADATLVSITDSSNNGDASVIDPNNNGNPSDENENLPTPFVLGSLPVKFINISASLTNKNTAGVNWQVAVPVINADKFEIEYSSDGRKWNKAGQVNIINASQSSYQFSHLNIPAGNLYYRIKQTDADGTFVFSKTVLLKNKNASGAYLIYPNPASDHIKIVAADLVKSGHAELFDATGRKLSERILNDTNTEIKTINYPDGTYVLQIKGEFGNITRKIIIKH